MRRQRHLPRTTWQSRGAASCIVGPAVHWREDGPYDCHRPHVAGPAEDEESVFTLITAKQEQARRAQAILAASEALEAGGCETPPHNADPRGSRDEQDRRPKPRAKPDKARASNEARERREEERRLRQKAEEAAKRAKEQELKRKETARLEALEKRRLEQEQKQQAKRAKEQAKREEMERQLREAAAAKSDRRKSAGATRSARPGKPPAKKPVLDGAVVQDDPRQSLRGPHTARELSPLYPTGDARAGVVGDAKGRPFSAPQNADDFPDVEVSVASVSRRTAPREAFVGDPGAGPLQRLSTLDAEDGYETLETSSCFVFAEGCEPPPEAGPRMASSYLPQASTFVSPARTPGATAAVPEAPGPAPTAKPMTNRDPPVAFDDLPVGASKGAGPRPLEFDDTPVGPAAQAQGPAPASPTGPGAVSIDDQVAAVKAPVDFAGAAGDEEAVPVERKKCAVCGRRFAVDVLERHVQHCSKKPAPRKTFDSAKNRMQGTDSEQFFKKSTLTEEGKTSTWRKQHEDFQRMIHGK